MPLDPARLDGHMPLRTRHAFARRDTILYALGVGAGSEDPTDPSSLRLTYEEGLAALPTMATVLAHPGFWQRDPRLGLDWRRILHAEQSVRLHRPLPSEGVVTGRTEIVGVHDRGAAKGALLYTRREIRDEPTGDLLATVVQGVLLRGDGGFGGRADDAPRPHPVPDRPADAALDLATRPEQALLYRLSGDANPLHADPGVAAAAGFPRPILHGLCTYGVVGRALLSALCRGDPHRLTRMDARFTSPVYPGETIRTEIWREAPGRAAFRARVPGRGVTVVDNGLAQYS